ncbi:MAG TPA: hypothetical protein VN903_02435 [Polyangia bacterium]|nr:hypothetical protein [Polyangia bacterium]
MRRKARGMVLGQLLGILGSITLGCGPRNHAPATSATVRVDRAPAPVEPSLGGAETRQAVAPLPADSGQSDHLSPRGRRRTTSSRSRTESRANQARPNDAGVAANKLNDIHQVWVIGNPKTT